MSTLPSAIAPRRLRRTLRLAARLLAGVLALAWLALLVGWLSLHWLILPHIQSWRGDIESRAGQMLGAPVTIGAIEVRSGGWVPAIELRDVRVLDAEKRTALLLPRVAAALSARSLLAFDLRFEQIYIDAPSLDIRRDASGRIRVAGLDFGGSAAATDDDGAAADWFFRQREFVIKGGTLRWIDEARQAPPLALGNVDLVVRNGLRGHELRLDATPPSGWGERFTLRGVFDQPLLARAGDWRRWSGEAYADLPRADVRELRRHVQLPFELAEGDGALRGWFEIESGEPRRATVDVALRTVALRLDRTVEPLEFDQVEGRVVAERRGGRDGVRTRIALQNFGFLTGDGIRWPKGSLSVAWRQPDGQAVTSGEFAAERLDVGVIAGIAGRVPLGKALRDLLAHVAPQGVITNLATRWDGPLDAPEHYRLAGKLSGLSLKPRAAARADVVGRPGLTNADVELDATEAGGKAKIAMRDGVLEFPGVFADPALSLQRLDATLAWTVDAAARPGDPPAVRVKVSDATFANADARGEFAAVWRTGDGGHASSPLPASRYPGILELDGRIADADAARAARYLPLGLPDDVRSYIGRAVLQGKVPSATVRVRGDLVDFPFHRAKSDREGEFRVAAHVEDMTFAYSPGDRATPSRWPPLTAASGDIVVDRATLEIRDGRARVGAIEWRGIKGGIATLGDGARLDASGDARGPLAEMLRFVETTPVGGWIGGVLSGTSGAGNADLKLALSLPLGDTEHSRVKGSLVLAGNDLRMTPDTPPLGAARARVDFTENSFAVVGATAKVLGGDLAFEGGVAPGEAPRFVGQGTATAEALRRAPELGSVARLANALNGQAAYRATLAFAGGRPQLGLTSNGVGLGIDLPPPLAKPAAATLPLRVQTTLDEASSMETLQVDLGSVVQGRFVRDAANGRVARGAIRVADDGTPGDTADALALPASGVAAMVSLKKLDIDAWEAAAARLLGDAPAAGGAPGSGAHLATPAATPAPLVFDAAGGAGYLPQTIALRAGEIGSGTRRLAQVTAGISRAGDTWQANVFSDQLDGYIEYRPVGRGRSAAGRVYARLARLSLPKGDVDKAPNLLEEPPASVPALDIVVDDFELRGKRLGRLEVEATNRAGRDWQLSRLALVMPEAQLSASGSWSAAAPGAPRRAAMDFTLSLADSGALLERLGMGKAVRGGKGQLAGSVSWPGSPLSPDVARMSGEVKVAIDSGQFLKASPGAARLLGVLSLQSLPRRLLLDFRDLFDEGFAFDNVTGDVRIGQGVAATNNLRMRGAAAAVLMEGEADLERETEDLRVVVVPEINAGTASLAYAIINPAVGLGTFLAQYLLRKPLAAASTREFRVTGPWDDPKVERVERSSASAEVLAGEPPASAASRPR